MSLHASFCNTHHTNLAFYIQVLLARSEYLICLFLCYQLSAQSGLQPWTRMLNVMNTFLSKWKTQTMFPPAHLSGTPQLVLFLSKSVCLHASFLFLLNILTFTWWWFWFNIDSASYIQYEIRDLQWRAITVWYPSDLWRDIVQWPQCKETMPLHLWGLGNQRIRRALSVRQIYFIWTFFKGKYSSMTCHVISF